MVYECGHDIEFNNAQTAFIENLPIKCQEHMLGTADLEINDFGSENFTVRCPLLSKGDWFQYPPTDNKIHGYSHPLHKMPYNLHTSFHLL